MAFSNQCLMEYKLSLITPTIYSESGSRNCIDPLSEDFASYLKHRADNEFHTPCKYNKIPGLAYIHSFTEFEERFLIHSEYAVIIVSPNSQDAVRKFLPRLLVFLTSRSIWQNRFLFVVLGTAEVTDSLVIHAPIKFSLEDWKTHDAQSWIDLFELIKVKWIPYNEPEPNNEIIRGSVLNKVDVSTQGSEVAIGSYYFICEATQQYRSIKSRCDMTSNTEGSTYEDFIGNDNDVIGVVSEAKENFERNINDDTEMNIRNTSTNRKYTVENNESKNDIRNKQKLTNDGNITNYESNKPKIEEHKANLTKKSAIEEKDKMTNVEDISSLNLKEKKNTSLIVNMNNQFYDNETEIKDKSDKNLTIGQDKSQNIRTDMHEVNTSEEDNELSLMEAKYRTNAETETYSNIVELLESEPTVDLKMNEENIHNVEHITIKEKNDNFGNTPGEYSPSNDINKQCYENERSVDIKLLRDYECDQVKNPIAEKIFNTPKSHFGETNDSLNSQARLSTDLLFDSQNSPGKNKDDKTKSEYFLKEEQKHNYDKKTDVNLSFNNREIDVKHEKMEGIKKADNDNKSTNDKLKSQHQEPVFTGFTKKIIAAPISINDPTRSPKSNFKVNTQVRISSLLASPTGLLQIAQDSRISNLTTDGPCLEKSTSNQNTPINIIHRGNESFDNDEFESEDDHWLVSVKSMIISIRSRLMSFLYSSISVRPRFSSINPDEEGATSCYINIRHRLVCLARHPYGVFGIFIVVTLLSPHATRIIRGLAGFPWMIVGMIDKLFENVVHYQQIDPHKNFPVSSTTFAHANQSQHTTVRNSNIFFSVF